MKKRKSISREPFEKSYWRRETTGSWWWYRCVCSVHRRSFQKHLSFKTVEIKAIPWRNGCLMPVGPLMKITRGLVTPIRKVILNSWPASLSAGARVEASRVTPSESKNLSGDKTSLFKRKNRQWEQSYKDSPSQRMGHLMILFLRVPIKKCLILF